MKEYHRQIEERSAKIEEISEREFPIDFSIYRIKLSEKDISERSERYGALVTVLALKTKS